MENANLFSELVSLVYCETGIQFIFLKTIEQLCDSDGEKTQKKNGGPKKTNLHQYFPNT